MILCQELQNKLEALWTRMQDVVVERNPGISQIDCDRETLQYLEGFVVEMEQRRQAAKFLGGF